MKLNIQLHPKEDLCLDLSFHWHFGRKRFHSGLVAETDPFYQVVSPLVRPSQFDFVHEYSRCSIFYLGVAWKSFFLLHPNPILLTGEYKTGEVVLCPRSISPILFKAKPWKEENLLKIKAFHKESATTQGVMKLGENGKFFISVLPAVPRLAGSFDSKICRLYWGGDSKPIVFSFKIYRSWGFIKESGRQCCQTLIHTEPRSARSLLFVYALSDKLVNTS